MQQDCPATIERVPVFKRVPVTQESMAYAVGHNRLTCTRSNCNCGQHLAQYHDKLHDCIIKLVYRVVNRYTIYSSDEASDMAHCCYLVIMKRLHLFNPKRNKLSTWVWHVVQSVMNSQYSAARKKSSRLAYTEDKILYGLAEHDSCAAKLPISDDIGYLVRQLVAQYPEHRKTIWTIFGNPAKPGWRIPDDGLNLRQAADDSGANYVGVCKFFRHCVVPVFRQHFAT